jgi:hypothetical protein
VISVHRPQGSEYPMVVKLGNVELAPLWIADIAIECIQHCSGSLSWE